LGKLRDVVALDRGLVQQQAPDAEVGAALGQVLDRVEGEHELVVLTGVTAVRGDAWLASSVPQADRTLIVLEPGRLPIPDAPPAELLRGCDVVLLGAADSPAVLELLDELSPRSTHRVREHEDVARLARRLTGHATGLVLSGGGARAFAHIGVIEELLAAGITIDRIGGASMGAFIGALLAQGMDAEEIDAVCYQEWVRRNPLGDYRLPRTSLIRGARVRALLERNLPGLIEDLPRSYYCVTTDIISAQLVVHRRGELATSVGASMSLPGVGPPVLIGGSLLVDGAVLDNLPISTMAGEGEGAIIASDVTEPEQRSLAPGEPPPDVNLVDTIARCILLGTKDTQAEGRRHAALYIEPDSESVGRLEFHMLDTARDAGRRAALKALEEAGDSLLI
jgi:predicted acylesterase/phospholipase RssA